MQKRRWRILWSLLGLLVVTSPIASHAQTGTITGRVTDAATGQALAAAQVSIPGTVYGTVADPSGNFRILEVPPGTYTLQASLIGYGREAVEDVAVRAGAATVVNLAMSRTAIALDEIVVVGYGEQSRETVTGSVSRVDEAEFSHSPGANPVVQMQGKVAGVSVQVSDGQPGSNPQVYIRGGTSTSPQNDQPLFVVDGVVSQGMRSISDMNPEDIESVQVLKDAASTAIYGSRAANGIVIITTKSGIAAEPRVNLRYTQGFEQQARRYDFLNARDYIYVTRRNTMMYNQDNPERYLTGRSFGMSPDNPRDSRNTLAFLDTYLENYGQEYVDQLLNGEGWETMEDPVTGRQLIFKDTDFQDVTFQPGYKQEIDLGIRGGGDRATYYAGLGFMDQDGIVAGTGYRNYSALLNGTYRLSDQLSFNAKVNYQLRDVNSPSNYQWVLSRSVKMPSTYRLQYENGLPAPGEGGGSFRSRLHEIYYKERYNDINVYRSTVQSGVDWSILPDLSFSSTASWFTTEGIENRFEASNETNTRRAASAYHGYDRHMQLDGLLRYEKDFGAAHNVAALAGTSYIDDYSYRMNGSGRGAPTDYIPTLNATSEETQRVSTTKATDVLLSYFGRLSYNYDQKYMLSGSLRTDGSSRFADNHRWGYFPGLSLGWNVHREDFWQPLRSPISRLKLRGSWGKAGNNELSIFDSQGRYSTGYTYLGDVGILNTSLINQNLVWETTTSADVGMDLGLFDDRITLLLDYYNKVTDDRLFNRPLWGSSGFSSIRSNYGSIRNRGVEVELAATPLQSRDFSWDLGFTFAFNRPTVVRLPENGEDKNRIGGNYVYDPELQEYVKVGGFAEGERFGGRWAYDMIGVYATDEEAANAPHDVVVNGRTKVGGDAIWRDVDGNGSIDHRDMVFMGYIMPDRTGGMINTLSFRGLTMRVAMDYALGHIIDNGFRARTNASARNNNNALSDVLSDDIWKNQGDQASIPRYTVRSDYDFNLMNHVRPSHGIGNRGYAGNTSLYYSKGDYLAFREISFSYPLGLGFLRRAPVNSLELSAGIYNLGYITAYDGLVPEVFAGTDPGLYPRPRQINLGIQANF